MKHLNLTNFYKNNKGQMSDLIGNKKREMVATKKQQCII